MNALLKIHVPDSCLIKTLNLAERRMRGKWGAIVTVNGRTAFNHAVRISARTKAKRFEIYERNAPLVMIPAGQTLITIDALAKMRRVKLPTRGTLVSSKERNRKFKKQTGPGLPVVIYGNVGGYNSVCKVTSGLALALEEIGVSVCIRDSLNEMSPVEDRGEWERHQHLIARAPDYPHAAIFQYHFKPRHNPKNIAWSARIDASDNFSTLEKKNVDERNSHDCMFTYSAHSKQVLENRGCERVRVMPLGVDTSIFKPVTTAMDFPIPSSARVLFQNFDGQTTGARFVFFIAGMMQARKGFPEVIHAFASTFHGRKDVLLWVHGRAEQWGEDFTHEMRADMPPMLWTDGHVSDEVLNSMLNRANCYLSPHRLEGFGLMPLQAMAAGTLCIVSDYAGPQDYAHNGNCLLLPVVETACRNPLIADGVVFGEWSSANLSARMREVMRGGVKVQSLTAAGMDTAMAWPWLRAAQAIVSGIEASGHTVNRS